MERTRPIALWWALLALPMLLAAPLGCGDTSNEGALDSVDTTSDAADATSDLADADDIALADAETSDSDTAGVDGGSDTLESDTDIDDTLESDTRPGDTVESDTRDADTASDGADGGDVVDADTGPAPVWDLAQIRDASTADCTFGPARTVFDDGVSLEVRNTSYLSWESIDGALVPIRIRGYMARPAVIAGKRPGIVLAHGLGGAAMESQATGLAALTGAVVIAYTGPGGGTVPENTSEGRASGYDNGMRMFDTIPDVRGAWFWGHAVAAMRAITCLVGRDDVDAAKIGMTGYSAGAVATLTVAGVDDRLVAAVPLSGTLAWDVATSSPSAWQHTLLRQAGLDITSPRWAELMELLAPGELLANTDAAVLMVNGTTDEFFPVAAHVATYDALPASRRTSFVGNFDHGCYAISGGESASTIESRADLRARGGQRMWFGHHFGTDARFANLPAAPTLTLTQNGPALVIEAQVDEPSGQRVVEVVVWWSFDDALVWASAPLDRQAAGRYGLIAPVTPPANAIAFVDVLYEAGTFGPRYSISSAPTIPAGHVPRIRAIDTCLAP